MDIRRDDEVADKIGKMFYTMLGIISDDIIKNDQFPEEIKKHMFQYSVVSYEDLDDETKERYITAGFSALQSGVDMFNFLTNGKENK